MGPLGQQRADAVAAAFGVSIGVRDDARAILERHYGDPAKLTEAMTREEIAGIVSKWTGIPVSKMLEGERDKLLRMETFGTAWDPPIPATIKPAILIIIVLVALQAISNLIADWHKLPEHHGLEDIDEVEIENIRRTLED